MVWFAFCVIGRGEGARVEEKAGKESANALRRVVTPRRLLGRYTRDSSEEPKVGPKDDL